MELRETSFEGEQTERPLDYAIAMAYGHIFVYPFLFSRLHKNMDCIN